MASVAAGFDSAKENKALRLDHASGRSTKADAASREQKKAPRSTSNSCKSSATAAFDHKEKHSSSAKPQAVQRPVNSSDQFRSVVLQSLLNRKLRNNGSAFASPVWRGKSSSNLSDSSVSASPARAVVGVQKQYSSTESKVVANSTSKKATVFPPEVASTSTTVSKESSSPSSVESRSGPATPVDENPSLHTVVSPGLVALKMKCKAADMPERMQQHALVCAQQAIDTSQKPQCKRVAWLLKKEFDRAYGPAWHCIVGSSFGSYVTHSSGGFVYFSIGKFSILLFKTAVELVEQ